GSAIAGLLMPDMRHGKPQHRTEACDLRRPLELALPRHGADPEPIRLRHDAGQLRDTIQVNQVIGGDQAKIQHWNERLSAGQRPRVLKRRQQVQRLTELIGSVVLERCRLQGWSPLRCAVFNKSNSLTGVNGSEVMKMS